MLKETHFNALKKIKEENKRATFIIVSRTRPTYSNGLYDNWYRSLSPSQSLLDDYKQRRIDWTAYTSRFTAEMNARPKALEQMQKIKELSAEKDVYLVCWCGPGKDCHRHLLIKMINGVKQATLF
jgi:uncharacterized protein YeaO (DUF488 family)